MTRPFLSVVVPAYNESAHLAGAVGELHAGLTRRHASEVVAGFELMVVENGSTDATLARARELAHRYPAVTVRSLPRPDYGGALRTGILAAGGDVVVCFDADYYDLDFLDRALMALADADMVLGSKRAAGSIDERPRVRRLVTAAFSGVLRVGFGLDLTDTHGMKAMRRTSLSTLVPACRFDGDLFDTELVVRAVRTGRRVIELPVVVAERRPPRTSILRRAPRALVGLIRLRAVLASETR